MLRTRVRLASRPVLVAAFVAAFAAVALLVSSLPALASAAPVSRIRLDPTSGGPGTVVTVTGEGFPAGALGTVAVRGGHARTVRAGDSGGFSTRLWISSDLPARTRVTASMGGAFASQRFAVLRPKPKVGWRELLRRADPPARTGPQPADALARRVRAELEQFTGWLARAGAQGYVGEVGWPRTDGRWNDLARVWYADAARAGLWVTNWATGEWWGGGYALSSYHAPDALRVRSANQQAQVIESQPHWYLRGVNVNGGEFGAVSGNPAGSPHRHSFSNATPGAYEHAYHYDTRATFDYLAGRGIGLVRLPFRWERVQPQPGGALDGTEVQRLAAAADRAGAAGLRVVLDLHNYGAYYLHDGSTGVRRTVGSSELTNAHFADVWSRLSAAFRSNPHVVGYGLMNEPVGTAGGARGWEDATQRAVDAIRARGDGTTVLVPGYNWSTVVHFPTQHPDGPWIRDPLGKVRYEAHQYFDRDNSGSYTHGYDAEVTDAQRRGY